MPAVTITWRDENYGDCHGATYAFRTYQISNLSVAQQRHLRVAARAGGFAWDDRRESWISYRQNAHRNLTTKLIDMGFDVTHAGRLGPEVFA